MMPSEIGLYDLFITQHEILDAMKQHGGSKVYYQNEEYEAFVGSDGVYLVKKDQNIFQRIFNIKKHILLTFEEFSYFCRLGDHSICGKLNEKYNKIKIY